MNLESIRARCSFLESRWFSWLSWIAAILAPLPLTAQLYKAFTAPSVEGIAIEAYTLLSFFHLIMIGTGIKSMNSKVVVNFFLTSTIAACIAVVALIRGGKFMFF